MKSNNGTQRKKYSRGTRLTFEVLHQICVWADCEKRDQLLRVNSPTPLPLYLTYAPAFGVLHAVVKEADDPQLMRFNVIPVLAAEAAPDDIQKSRLIQFGLYQTHNGQPHWVSWTMDQFTAGTGTATLVSDLRRARVARGWQDGAGKPFRILVDGPADPYKLVVLLNRASPSRLTWEGEEFPILSFRKFRQAQPAKNLVSKVASTFSGGFFYLANSGLEYPRYFRSGRACLAIVMADLISPCYRRLASLASLNLGTS